MVKIVTVYNDWRRRFDPTDMSYIRWLKISEALARRGHQVDIATNELRWLARRAPIPMAKNLRRVSLASVRWNDYDVVKTLFHIGFDTLETYGGCEHPFIISKLGSVVAPYDREGIYFYGKARAKLFDVQKKINDASRYITLLSRPAEALWREYIDTHKEILIVPGGVDADISQPRRDPFPKQMGKRCLFAGNIYGQNSQPEANRVLVTKLNQLGRLLTDRGSRLYLLGSGDVSGLDRDCVTYLGAAPYNESWDYFHYADVGIVVSAGVHHNNESSKIYHYLRAGLPVVSEAGFPNDDVIVEARLGFVVDNGNLELMAKKVEEAAHKEWDCYHAVNYILNKHTWDKRADVYDNVFKDHFA
jgi:glycosyltransferase involved in cell wall biosynthesis